MKKLFAIIFSAIIISAGVCAISGCGCSNKDNSDQPATAIVGDWGGRSDDIEAEFNDDGTCIIGGVTGTYTIDENNNLIVTPNTDEETSAEPLTFEYYSGSNTSAIQPDQWTVVDNVLYINGQQYNGATNPADSSDTQGNNTGNSTDSQNSSSSAVSNNSSSNNAGSSGSSADSSSSSGSNASSSGSSSSNNSSSSSSGTATPDDSSKPTDSDNSSSSAPESLNENEETKMVDIIENIDDF
ncbi:MAG: hypothetical protein UD936_05530 [Acutalibacteraceae bacterium]|nr:hypothetical protein [Acutalibacteraceae bacterium]